jgi:hypothetical protein
MLNAENEKFYGNGSRIAILVFQINYICVGFTANGANGAKGTQTQ